MDLACSRLLERRAKERARGQNEGDWGREKEREKSPPRFRPLALSFARLSRSLEQARMDLTSILAIFELYLLMHARTTIHCARVSGSVIQQFSPH